MALGFLIPVFGVAGAPADPEPARPTDPRSARRHASFQVGFEVGVFSRFFMETEEKDLIGTDFRVGIPLSVAVGGWGARLEARHMSAHLGDDYLVRFEQEPEKTGYDGFELTLARRIGAARLYAGGELNWEKEEIVERSAARAGLEIDPTLAGPIDGLRPFAAFDLRMTEKTERVEGTVVAGLVFPAGSFRLRLEAWGHYGPSGLGQLRLADEESIGIGLRVETGRSPLP